MAPHNARRSKSKLARRRVRQPASASRATTTSSTSRSQHNTSGTIITRGRHSTTETICIPNDSSGSTTSQHNTSNLFFERLPPGVFDMILHRLSVQDISVFSMVSKHTNSYVMDHISSTVWRRRTIVQGFHHAPSLSYDHHATMQHYRDLGLLFKRCTLLLPTKDRLKFTFSKFSQVGCFMMEPCAAGVRGCYGVSCYGAFLKTLIAGWDKMEYPRVFSFLCEITSLPRKIELAVKKSPGVSRFLELQVRHFCRHVLLDPWWNEGADFLFWLTHILKPLPMVSQARLLFILYGPLMPDGSVGWEDMRETGVHRTALLELSRVIFLMHSDTQFKEWSTDTMLAIMEELIVLPEAWHQWHVENVACLLLQCGSSLCYSVLTSKALNGRLFEISRLIIHIVMVCERDGYCMSWAVKLVRHLCQVFVTNEARQDFIDCLENTFSELTMEMYEHIAADHQFEDMESVCRLLHSSAHFHSQLLQMFLK